MSNSYWSRFGAESYLFNFHAVHQLEAQVRNHWAINLQEKSPFATFVTYEMFIAEPPALIQPILVHQSLLLFCYFRRVRITRLLRDKPLSPSLMNKYGPKVRPGVPAASDERCASPLWNLIDLLRSRVRHIGIRINNDPTLYPRFFVTTVLQLYNISSFRVRLAGSIGLTRGSQHPRLKRSSKLLHQSDIYFFMILLFLQ